MLAEHDRAWTFTIAAGSLAVVLATVGLLMPALAPAAPAAFPIALLVASLAATATAFTVLARRVHRLEMENLGLVEEISQEFDSVRDKLEIFGEALADPQRLTVTEHEVNVPARRVEVK